MNNRLRIILAATLLATTATTAAASEPEWIKQFGGTRAGDLDSATGVAIGANGRVHVVGCTSGALGGAYKGRGDSFVITFEHDGTELWRRQPGTSAQDCAYAVATDVDGGVTVVGFTSGALGGTFKGGYSDAFVIKYDRDGRTLWTRQPGTTALDIANGVATDSDGNIFVVGETDGALGGTNKGHSDAFVIKYDRDGHTLWKRRPGTTALDIATAVATDTNGNVTVAGYTYSALGGTFKGGYSDAFVIKYDRDGRTLWTRQPGTTAMDRANGVATDPDGNIYVVGETWGALGGTFKGGYSDAFVIKYDRDGRTLWTRQPGSPERDWASGVATDAAGNVHVVGTTTGLLGGPKKGDFGDFDAFIIKYDRDGRNVWRDQAGSDRSDYPQGVAVDADGDVYVAGGTNGSLSGNANTTNTDAFLIKYGPNGPQ
ncbi:MAG: SBBP repeat-containing protein [Rhodospirillales bacterium]|nr:SBBP repeat-containing protein [Rhodospirillales bacterium]